MYVYITVYDIHKLASNHPVNLGSLLRNMFVEWLGCFTIPSGGLLGIPCYPPMTGIMSSCLVNGMVGSWRLPQKGNPLYTLWCHQSHGLLENPPSYSSMMFPAIYKWSYDRQHLSREIGWVSSQLCLMTLSGIPKISGKNSVD